MTTPDRVAPEVRAAEEEIDQAYCSNPLMGKPFAEAAWFFLAHCEEVQFKDFWFAIENGVQNNALLVDEIVNAAKWPLRWISRDCPVGGQIPQSSFAGYDHAWSLYKLAIEYASFESAFTYATIGAIDLTLDGQRLIPSSTLRADTRYEAYDRLAKPARNNPAAIDLELLEAIDRSVRVSGTRFRYTLTPPLVESIMDMLASMYPESMLLPLSWQFPRYSIVEVDAVYRALQAMAFIHLRAHNAAGMLGCHGCGYLQSVLVMGADEIENRLQRYTHIAAASLTAILRDLTYGIGQQSADPALQPLIMLTAERIAVPPILVIGSDYRRNFAALLNRMPSERKDYSALVDEREKLCRDRIVSICEECGFRTWFGGWPGRRDLPDIDLVVVSDIDRHCLFLELKSFIEPAEPREIIQRDEEIKKGIKQATKLRTAYEHDSLQIQAIIRCAGYSTTFAVSSESGIGSFAVQDEQTAVVRTSHLLRRFECMGSLKSVCLWLERREYLPVVGQHFEERTIVRRIGEYELEWYGIRPLIDGEFD